MARSITIATGKVALTVSFPVEVLIKSEPKTQGRNAACQFKHLFFYTSLLSQWKKGVVYISFPKEHNFFFKNKWKN